VDPKVIMEKDIDNARYKVKKITYMPLLIHFHVNVDEIGPKGCKSIIRQS
jgi:hypothetical protein